MSCTASTSCPRPALRPCHRHLRWRPSRPRARDPRTDRGGAATSTPRRSSSLSTRTPRPCCAAARRRAVRPGRATRPARAPGRRDRGRSALRHGLRRPVGGGVPRPSWRAGASCAGLVLTEESAFGRDRSAGLPRSAGSPMNSATAWSRSHVWRGRARSYRARGCAVCWRRVGCPRSQRLLGRRYSVIGTVVKGDQRGRELGLPTANLQLRRTTSRCPTDGIYAVRVAWDAHGPAGQRQRRAWRGVARRPADVRRRRRTDPRGPPFDFDGDLYGKTTARRVRAPPAWREALRVAAMRWSSRWTVTLPARARCSSALP